MPADEIQELSSVTLTFGSQTEPTVTAQHIKMLLDDQGAPILKTLSWGDPVAIADLSDEDLAVAKQAIASYHAEVQGLKSGDSFAPVEPEVQAEAQVDPKNEQGKKKSPAPDNTPSPDDAP